MSLDEEVRGQVERSLRILRSSVQKLKTIEPPPQVSDSLLEEVRTYAITSSHQSAFSDYAGRVNEALGDLFNSQVSAVIEPLEEFMSFSERAFFSHDVANVLVDVGVFSPNRGRPSSYNFFSRFKGREIPDFSVENLGDEYHVKVGGITRTVDSEEEVREIMEHREMNIALRRLYSKKTLINALENWHQNFVAGADSYYLLFAYIPDRFNLGTGSFEIGNIANSIRGLLANSFFAFTQAECPHRVNIEAVGGEGIYTDTPGLMFSWLYNLAKNAMKRSEELYAKQRAFQGGNVRMVVDQDEHSVYGAVAQTFDGIDLKEYARLGYGLVSANHDLVYQITPEAVKRYEQWIASRFGDRFGELRVSDMTDLAFLANVSGARISSKTSGIGLYATQQLVSQRGGEIAYFFNPNQDASNHGEGFLIRLPKKEVRLAA